MPDHAMKRCPGCSEAKPLDAFSPDGRRRDGRQSHCKTCRSGRMRATYSANRDERRQKSREWYQANIEAEQARHRRAKRESYGRAREQVFGHYGTACACCGTTDRLTIDHIAGNGGEHRAAIFPPSMTGSGGPFHAWLVRNGFPPGYQTLCVSCNSSKKRGARCRLDHT